MIIVTGATGLLGHQIVERLLTRVPAQQIGVSVREPQKAQDLADRGVRVRQGSFTDPDSLAHAFEGASQVFIVSVDKMGEECVSQHRVAIDAAVAAGTGSSCSATAPPLRSRISSSASTPPPAQASSPPSTRPSPP